MAKFVAHESAREIVRRLLQRQGSPSALSELWERWVAREQFFETLYALLSLAPRFVKPGEPYQEFLITVTQTLTPTGSPIFIKVFRQQITTV